MCTALKRPFWQKVGQLRSAGGLKRQSSRLEAAGVLKKRSVAQPFSAGKKKKKAASPLLDVMCM